jgi:hypothetical protein
MTARKEFAIEERERRLRNLSQAVGFGLLKEIERHKNSLSLALSEDFKREINLADKCVYIGDFDGLVYHGLIADMIHRMLKDMEK